MSDWTTDGGDPRRQHAPEVLDALQRSCASVRLAADQELLELARLRLATMLGNPAERTAPAWGAPPEELVADLDRWPTSEAVDDRTRAALDLTEQFAIDVTGVGAGPLGPAAALLEADVLPFVQGLYLLDVGQRAAIALSALFSVPLTSLEWAWPGEGSDLVPADPMAAVDELMRATGRLTSLDPVLRELVRLRGARHHQCRRCQSVRSVAALQAGADEALLGADDPSTVADLPAPTRAALALVDAVVGGRPEVPEAVVADVRATLSPAEAVELVCYLVRNSANKIAVAFGADAAIVDEGFEYQVIAPDGDTVTVDAPA